jgi:MFS family permease
MRTQALLPRTVWTLAGQPLHGYVLRDYPCLAALVRDHARTSVAAVGLIDGIAEATASITKVFSGWLSDRIGRRKPLILLGYGLAGLSKPLFPIASGALAILGARFADRIGKGIRGAPRDALIADVTPSGMRGRAFGLVRRWIRLAPSLALAGARADVVACRRHATRLWVAVGPAALAVPLVVPGVEDRQAIRTSAPLRWSVQSRRRLLGRRATGTAFSLARFSEAFGPEGQCDGLDDARATGSDRHEPAHLVGAYPERSPTDTRPPALSGA